MWSDCSAGTFFLCREGRARVYSRTLSRPGRRVICEACIPIPAESPAPAPGAAPTQQTAHSRLETLLTPGHTAHWYVNVSYIGWG